MMKTNSTGRILDENGIIIASSIPGEVGKKRGNSSPQLNSETEEKLLPTGFNSEEDEKPVQTNQKVEPLYPIGVNPE